MKERTLPPGVFPVQRTALRCVWGVGGEAGKRLCAQCSQETRWRDRSVWGGSEVRSQRRNEGLGRGKLAGHCRLALLSVE